MKKRKHFQTACAVVWMLMISVCLAVMAPVPDRAAEAASSSVEKSQKKSCWIQKGKKYYWVDATGFVYKKQGLLKVGKYKYYLNRDGSRAQNCFKKIKGKYYYFNSKGRMYCPEKKTLATLPAKSGNQYYVYKDGHVATGLVKIKGKYYYFNSKGKLQKDKRTFKIGKQYYDIDKKGVAVKLSTTKVQCRQAARSFIAKHSKSSQTRDQKFRSCFNYLLAYMRYTPGYFPVSRDYAIINKADGACELALSTFKSPYLRGNCHRFASCIAAIAGELGYSDPTVIHTTGDHSFVMINGRYYDNMYGGLFGARSRPGSYRVYKKVVF